MIWSSSVIDLGSRQHLRRVAPGEHQDGEAERHRLDTRLAVECEAEALRARGRLEAEKARILAEIERLREESRKPRDHGSPSLDYYESEALRDRLEDFEAKYRAFGGTIPDGPRGTPESFPS